MMSKIKDVLLSIIALFVSYGVYRFSASFINSVVSNDFLSSLLCQAVFTIMALLSVLVLKKLWIYRVDLRKLKFGWTAALLLLSSLAIPFFTALEKINEISVTQTEFLMFVGQMFLIGFCEETLFRGLIQNAFHNLFGENGTFRVYLGVLFGALCFGGMHLMNAFSPEVSFNTALLQAIQTFGSGILFGTVYFRTGKNLWLLIFIHALNDFLAFIATGRLSGSSIGQAISNSTATTVNLDFLQVLYAIAFYSAIALLLLRPKKIRQLQEVSNK